MANKQYSIQTPGTSITNFLQYRHYQVLAQFNPHTLTERWLHSHTCMPVKFSTLGRYQC